MRDWQEFLQPYEVPVAADDPRRADHELLFEFQKSFRVGDWQRESALGSNYLFQEMLKLPDARRADLVEVAWARIEGTKARY